MGGKNEGEVRETTTNRGATRKVRFHINNGEVHFHSDSHDLKVAVPIADFYNGWQNLLNNVAESEWYYPDVKRNAMVCIRLVIKKPTAGNFGLGRKKKNGPPKGRWLDADVSVVPLGTSDAFKALQQLTE